MKTDLKPPVAKIEPRVFTLHGDTRTDNYFWLRERSNPEVMAYLEAENKYTAAVMQPTEPLQAQLYRELLGYIKETDQSAPEKLDNYYYYERTETGKAYPIYCRKQGSLDAPEEILLDQNLLAEGHDFCQLGVFQVSPDHKLLAYSVDLSGAETFTLYLKDLTTGQLLPDQIRNTYYSLAWANDNRTFFYTVLDEAKRPYQLYRHTLGTGPRDDVLLYHETDEMYNMFLHKSRSKAYILVYLRQSVTSEWHYLSADDPTGQFRVIQPRQHGLEYLVDHHGDEFFILTNAEAENFRVMTVSTANPAKAQWRELIPHRPAVKVDELLAFEDHLVLFEREQGLPQIQVIHLPDQTSHYVEFTEPAYTIWPQGNREFQTAQLRFGYSSLVTPPSTFDYEMNDRTRDLKKQEEVPGYDPAQYQSERIFATAADGVPVPISLVYKKGLVKDGRSPLLMHGYGAYEASMDAYFASRRLCLLERGFVFAIPHIRGGGEMGRRWYEQGKLLHKRNSFTDFIACAEHLVVEKYTSADKLVAFGRSAGGLLMGAVTNIRPDLFKVVVAGVPFVDAINTMLDASIPLTTSEFEEWGNPADPTYYAYIKSYSPYDNVEAKAYPHLLVTAGLNDPRVQYWEPAKWVARLRALKTDQNVLLLKTEMSAGHSGPSDRYAYLREWAFTYAFILDRLGIYA
ncbi:MAG: oligopeptidase B [Anaerolineae bacterium]|nr:S9 family peptidase [Anaerolineales bacterium]MCQ3975737.1 oligopeptidase B [Anaerolineae bacterium]